MATIICPKCGTENLESAMNCTQCHINLQFALEQEYPEELERPKVAETRPAPESIDETNKEKKSLGMRLRFALVGMVLPAVGEILFLILERENIGSFMFPFLVLIIIGGFCASVVGMRYQEKWHNRPVLLYSVVLLASVVLPGLILGFCYLAFIIAYISVGGV